MSGMTVMYLHMYVDRYSFEAEIFFNEAENFLTDSNMFSEKFSKVATQEL